MTLGELGIELPDLVWGTMGGVCNAFVFNRSTVREIAGAVVVGAVAGCGLTTVLVKLSPWQDVRVGLAIIAGFAGGALLKTLGAYMLKRSASLNGNGAK